MIVTQITTAPLVTSILLTSRPIPLVERIKNFVEKLNRFEHFNEDEKNFLYQWALNVNWGVFEDIAERENATNTLLSLLIDLVYTALDRQDQRDPDTLEGFAKEFEEILSQIIPQNKTVSQVIEDFVPEAPMSSVVIKRLILGLLSHQALNSEEGQAIEDWRATVNVKILDHLSNDNIREIASLALTDLLCSIVYPLIRRTKDQTLLAAETIIRNVLVKSLPTNATLDLFIQDYEKCLLELKARDERLRRIAGCMQEQLKHLVVSVRRINQNMIDHYEQLQQRMIVINQSRGLAVSELSELLKDSIKALNALVDQLAEQADKSEILGRRIDAEDMSLQQLLKECDDVLNKF